MKLHHNITQPYNTNVKFMKIIFKKVKWKANIFVWQFWSYVFILKCEARDLIFANFDASHSLIVVIVN